MFEYNEHRDLGWTEPQSRPQPRMPIDLRPPLGAPVRLTPTETAIWYELSAHLGQVCSGPSLLWIGWGAGFNWYDSFPDRRISTRNLVEGKLYILRRLLDAAGGRYRIENIHGKGWRLVVT